MSGYSHTSGKKLGDAVYYKNTLKNQRGTKERQKNILYLERKNCSVKNVKHLISVVCQIGAQDLIISQ